MGTPFDSGEGLHEEGMRLQVRMQIQAGADALLLLGTMGCMQMLKDETFRRAVEVTADEAGDKIPVLVGCGDTGTERTLERLQWAEHYPIGGIVLIPPYYFRFTRRELYAYFASLARATDLPVYLYDNPYFTKHALELELVKDLSRISNIVGLKESGELVALRRAVEYFSNSKEFRVFSGDTHFFDVALQLGAHGIVDGLFAAAPELGVGIHRSIRQGDTDAAAAYQRKLARFSAIVHVDSIFAGFTAAMNLRGVPGNFAPRPFTQITPQGRRKVRAILRELNLI